MEDKCIKCDSTMKQGFVFDRSDGNQKQQQIWVEGTAEKSLWSGIKTSGKTAFNVRANRCGNCGFLEFYADSKADLSGVFSGLFGN